MDDFIDSTVQPSVTRSLTITSPNRPLPVRRTYSEIIDEIEKSEKSEEKRVEGTKYLQLFMYQVLSKLEVIFDNHSNLDSDNQSYSVEKRCHELLTAWNEQTSIKQSWKVALKNIRRFKTSLISVAKDGDTPLDVAAKNGDVEVAKSLLNAGANVNFTDKNDDTALHKASRKGNLQIVECLVNANADISIANKDGDSALDVAAKHGNLDVVEFLLSKGASIYTPCKANTNGDTTLHKAAKWNKLEVVKYLIKKHGMDINTFNEKEHDTSLHVTAKWGVEDVAKWLLNVGANFTIKNRKGYTPLYCAIKWENEEIEQYLRNAGAPEIFNNPESPHFKVVKILVDISFKKSLNIEKYEADLKRSQQQYKLHGLIDWKNIHNVQQKSDLMLKIMSDVPSDREIEIINAVSDFYEKSSFGEHRPHVIAALVIEEDGMYRPVILAAGTKYSKQHGIIACFEGDHWNIYDGHAEAICYQMAIIYILKEVINTQKGRPSIFESIEDQYKYQLKKTIKFHLLISKRPCGFMAKKTSNFLSWKSPLQILDCSSKILIGSFLGIQGPLSCLLSKPVYISSVLILEDWKMQSTEEKEEKPNLSDVKDRFLKFHEKLKEYNADENMLSLPDVTIRKVNLQVFFNNLLGGKLAPKHCHLIFDKTIFGEDANFSTTQKFCVDEGENIGSKIIKQLQKIDFHPSLSLLVKNCQSNSYLKAFKICNKALEINEAVKYAYDDANEHLKNLAKSMKKNHAILSSMLAPNISENSRQVIEKSPYSYEDKQKCWEYEPSEQKIKHMKEPMVLNAILSLKCQMEQTSVILDFYNEQLDIKNKTFKCLTEVDCDWVKWISILHRIVG